MHVYRLAIALFVVSTNAYHVVGAPEEEEDVNYAVDPDIDIADIKPDPASEATIRAWDTKYVSSSFSPDHDHRDDGAEDVIRGWNSNSQPSAELDLQDMRSLFQDMRSLQTSTSAPSGGGDPLAPPTNAPTPPPTSFPSRSPVTSSPVSTAVAEAQAQAESAFTPPADIPADEVISIEVTVPAEVSFDGIPCDPNAAATLYAASEAALLKEQCGNPDGTLREGCTIQVNKFVLCGEESSISRRLTKFFRGLRSSRKLSTGKLEIDFSTKILAYCQSKSCDDAADIIKAVEAVVEQTIAAATDADTSSGATTVSPLLAALIDEVQKVVEVQQQQAVANGVSSTSPLAVSITALTTLATELGTATTAPAKTLDAIAPAVATLIAAAQQFNDEKDWYPNWSGSDHTCKNDGNAPFYSKYYLFCCKVLMFGMSIYIFLYTYLILKHIYICSYQYFSTVVYNGNWIKSSLTECCTHYYSTFIMYYISIVLVR